MAVGDCTACGTIEYLDPTDDLIKELYYCFTFDHYPTEVEVVTAFVDQATETVCDYKVVELGYTDCAVLVAAESVQYEIECEV